jgi:hypothetical protein
VSPASSRQTVFDHPDDETSDGYRGLVDPVLQRALDVLLPELRRTSGPRPIVEERTTVNRFGEAVTNVMFLNQKRHGQGVQIHQGEWPYQLADVADQIQEWAVEELWNQGRPATWPACPFHPGSHPLDPVVVAGTALWRCPKTAEPVAALGELGP